MAAAQTLNWLERLVWITIYGGLLGIVLSLFVADEGQDMAATMQCLGGILVALGVSLIWVRSRLKLKEEQ